jgi:hypothetical protein
MKKLFSLTSLIFIAIALITVSCEKTPEELLIGKWEVKSLNVKLYLNNVLQDEATEPYEANAMVIEFLEGGTGKEYEDNVLNDTFGWTVNGDKLSITFIDEDPQEVTFSVGEDDLTFSMTESETDPSSGDVTRMVMTFTLKRI